LQAALLAVAQARLDHAGEIMALRVFW